VSGSAAGTVSGCTAPGCRFTVSFRAIFIPRHDLTVYFTSVGSVPVSLGLFRAATSPALAATTDAAGAAAISATMPGDASAPVTVQATDGTTTASITVPVEAAAVPASGVGSAVAGLVTTESGLATTGTAVSFATVGGAIGVVVLGAAFLVFRRVRRDRRGRAETGG
jgi:LPXTG-motif cell wall-anchored protein